MLDELRNKLNITWSDEETETRLRSILKSAQITINFKLGANVDYNNELMERNLLLNYCMYAYHNCENEFDNAYFNEIMQLRQKYEVLNYEEQI